MKWAKIAFAAASVILLSAQTSAPSELMTHYRAYRAALEAGDLATAETEAQAALQASVARDGEGGRTGVLALNLAQARLQGGRGGAAYEPALQAFNIAAARADSGVDPLLASLVVGRAELAGERARHGRERLDRALADAIARPDLHDDAYFAAAELGRYYASQNLFATSAETWALAARLADPNRPDRRIAYAEARIGEGIARYTQVARVEDAQRNRPTDTRLRPRTGGYAEADQAFAEAERILSEFAYTDGGGANLTPAQSMFGLVRAWRNVLHAFLYSTDQQNVVAGQRFAEQSALAYGVRAQTETPLCDIDIIAEPAANFPPNAEQRAIVGGVVVRMLITPDGQVQDTRVAGAVPQAWFSEEVERVMGQWRVERLPTSRSDCTFPRILFFSYSFRFH